MTPRSVQQVRNNDQVLASSIAQHLRRGPTDRLRRILDLVEETLTEPGLNGQALAERAYLTRFHFDRLVKAALGEPPGAFRRRLLLERAAYRLATDDTSVLTIAVEAGYGSAEAFTRAFARGFGITPSRYRTRPRARHELPSPNHIHFHPPGGLRLPATRRSYSMDVLTEMLDHHLDLVGKIIHRTTEVEPAVLDQPIELSVERIDRNPTLRTVTDRLVSQLEMWLAATAGETTAPTTGSGSPEEMRTRLEIAGPRFRNLAVDALNDGRADETFLDATCELPRYAEPSRSALSRLPESQTSVPATRCTTSVAPAPTLPRSPGTKSSSASTGERLACTKE